MAKAEAGERRQERKKGPPPPLLARGETARQLEQGLSCLTCRSAAAPCS